MLKWCKNFFEKLVVKERSPKVLALSFCVGVYIAFSPYIFLHTLMAFAFSWIFSLNLAVVFAASCMINNPWTLVPIYTVDYLFGQWFLTFVLGVNSMSLNPHWMDPVNSFIYSYTGIQGVSFWAFMIGGNLLGLIISVIMYPVVRCIFLNICNGIYITENSCKMEIDEDYCSK